MNMTRRAFIATCAALPLYARAEQWDPSESLRFIVPYPPGASFDFLARVMSPMLGKNLGQSIVVDNRGGASGQIGTDLLARANPDGYTIGLGNPSTHTLPIALHKKIPYEPFKDFTPLSFLVKNLTGIAVNPKLPVKTLAELVDYARKNPGKISFGSPGAGTSPHLQGEMLNQVAGIDMVHIGYKGGGPAMTDLLAGQVQVGFGTLVTFIPLAKQGRLRLLAVLDDERYEGMPELPTANEAFPGYNPRAPWMGAFGPAGMPAPVANRLHDELVKAVRAPDVRKKLSSNGYVVVGSSPAELTAIMHNDVQSWGEVVRKRKIVIG